MRIKHFILLICLVFLYNCNTQKYSSDIIYFLPTSVSEIIERELQKPNYKNPYMVLYKENEDYIIYVCRGKHPIFVQYSNRSVFINNDLIPLYFASYEYFAYAQKGKDVLKNMKNGKELLKRIYIRENTFSIKFDLSGKIKN